MSHEGIRLVSAEQARREEHENRELPRDAKEPAKVRVHKTEGTGLEIDWKDGHKSSWSFAWLRHACPCATCHDEREKSGRKPGEPKPQPANCCPCIRLRRGPTSSLPSAATLSASNGTTATRAAFIHGII